ncbi:Aldolase_II domain-containing protein [Gammaproteobacteria bacterium]
MMNKKLQQFVAAAFFMVASMFVSNVSAEPISIVNEIVKYSQKLDQKGFTANHDGNISAKLNEALLATPTSISKGNVTASQVIILDKKGNKTAGIGKPFSELKLHLVAYSARPDIKAVIHAHPPFATARGLLNSPIKPAIPEAIVSIGDIVPVVAFAMPSARENDDILAKALAEVDVVMMPGNGVLAVGDSVEQAYLRLELVEHLAKIDYYARTMGTPMKLAGKDIATLLAKRASIGLGPKKDIAAPQQETKAVKKTN